ncbi:MAG: hypothetical protein HFJ55_02740 [Clostridia bacterium]|nr:hypothetical protein [Clostridia bacterium]
MRLKMKKSLGVTMISLVIGIVILIIISGMLIYNSKSGIQVRSYKWMQNDIEVLENEIDAFYIKYGALPISHKYTNIKFEPQPNDIQEYYIIDLAALDGFTLNYGKDYEKLNGENLEENYDDIYIIDKQSHHIYYARGIEMDGVWYHTNTADNEVTYKQISQPQLTILHCEEETNETIQTEHIEVESGKKYTASTYAKTSLAYNGKNYTYLSASEDEILMDWKDQTITLYYSKDEIGKGSNINMPDGIPDKYQVIVEIAVEHGSFTGGEKTVAIVVTLMSNGVPSENGIGHLADREIPDITADAGYTTQGGTWSPYEPTPSLPIHENIKFTYTCALITPPSPPGI